MIRECAVCGEEYDTAEKRKGGYITHCDDCSEETVERYIGRQGLTNKDASISIIRTDLEYWRSQIARENAAGFNANLPISNAPFEQAKQVTQEDRE